MMPLKEGETFYCPSADFSATITNTGKVFPSISVNQIPTA
jgi:hypothetical protein